MNLDRERALLATIHYQRQVGIEEWSQRVGAEQGLSGGSRRLRP